jgi:hypothetical protein
MFHRAAMEGDHGYIIALRWDSSWRHFPSARPNRQNQFGMALEKCRHGYFTSIMVLALWLLNSGAYMHWSSATTLNSKNYLYPLRFYDLPNGEDAQDVSSTHENETRKKQEDYANVATQFSPIESGT